MKKIIQQAFFQLRNQPLLSVITVLGTALAIALIMVILIVYQAKTADYAPEVNRSRSLYVKWERTVYDKKDPNSAGHSRPSLWLVKEIFYPLTTPEAVTATYEGGGSCGYRRFRRRNEYSAYVDRCRLLESISIPFLGGQAFYGS